MEVEKKYEISETNARNFFVNRRANITLLQMRKMAKDVNPEEFFIPADETIDGKFFLNKEIQFCIQERRCSYCQGMK